MAKAQYPIGTVKLIAGRNHIKTENGWKFYGKGNGKKAQSYVSGEIVVPTQALVKKALKLTYMTELEFEVLQNICNSEYQDQGGEGVVEKWVWSFSVTNEERRLAGALGSCVKKGWAKCQDKHKGFNDHEICMITQDGYNTLQKEIAANQ